MTITAFATGTTALIDGQTGFLLVFDQQPVPQPPQPPANFAACSGLAEMHRQAAYLQAGIDAGGDPRLLRFLIMAADRQYFLDVLNCGLQFGESSPSAVDGLADVTARMMKERLPGA